jgi:hypothetical protein
MVEELVLPPLVLVAVADEDLGSGWHRLRHGAWTSFCVV